MRGRHNTDANLARARLLHDDEVLRRMWHLPHGTRVFQPHGSFDAAAVRSLPSGPIADLTADFMADFILNSTTFEKE